MLESPSTFNDSPVRLTREKKMNNVGTVLPYPPCTMSVD